MAFVSCTNMYRWVTTNCCFICALTLVPPRLPSGRARIQENSTTPATPDYYIRHIATNILCSPAAHPRAACTTCKEIHIMLDQCHTCPILLPLRQQNSTYMRSVFYLTLSLATSCRFVYRINLTHKGISHKYGSEKRQTTAVR